MYVLNCNFIILQRAHQCQLKESEHHGHSLHWDGFIFFFNLLCEIDEPSCQVSCHNISACVYLFIHSCWKFLKIMLKRASLTMGSTGLEVLRDRRTASGRHDTFGLRRASVLVRQRRPLQRRPAVSMRQCRIQINLAWPKDLRSDVERQAAKQTNPHRGQKSDEELMLTVVHPDRSR